MDATETHYLTYSPEDLWKAMQNAYIEAGGEALYPGDEKEMLLRAVQLALVQAFAGMDNALRMQTLRYAVGDYLDLIGETRGVARREATKAHVYVNFFVVPQTSTMPLPVTYPAGTLISADNKNWYTLDNGIMLTESTPYIIVGATALEAGSAGNALTSGTSMFLGRQYDAASEQPVISAREDASGGTDAEDDEAYRRRIYTWGLNAITGGSAAAYEAVAEDVSSSIIDAKAYNGGAGTVYLYLLIQAGASYETLRSAVENALIERGRPMTDGVLIRQATDVEYVMLISYVADSAVSSSVIQSAVEEYQTWQDNGIGRAFNPDRLFALLYQAGVTHFHSKQVRWPTEQEPGDWEEPVYTEIGQGERLKGTLTVIPYDDTPIGG